MTGAPHWTLGPSRTVMLDGEPVFELSRVNLGGSSPRYKLDPASADAIAHDLVEMLNAADAQSTPQEESE